MNILKERIHEFVKKKPWASFVDLEGEFGDEMKGEYDLIMVGYPKVILWGRVNDKFADAFTQLHSDKKIKFIAEGQWSLLNYTMDGFVMDQPIATEFKDYDEPHWLPIVLIDYDTYYENKNQSVPK